MKRYSRRTFLATGSAALGAASVSRAYGLPGIKGEIAASDWLLWYKEPAAQWIDGLPIGNGNLGAIVFGGGKDGAVNKELLSLNDDTLWSGSPHDGNNPEAPKYLGQLRHAVLDEKNYHLADELSQKMQGKFAEAYQPLGNLNLELTHSGSPADYRRQLDLDTAIAKISYVADGVRFEREAFVSYPDQALVLRITASKPRQLRCRIALDGPLTRDKRAVASDRLLLTGKAAAHIAGAGHPHSEQPVVLSDRPGEGMYFAAALQVHLEDGRCSSHEGELVIEDATAITILLTTATGFTAFDRTPDTPLSTVIDHAVQKLRSTSRATFDALRSRHVADHQKLFRRVSLDLGQQDTRRPTDERLQTFAQREAPELLALYFQYGRYLMIGSSRPGTQPVNLQGIWNDQVTPPWSSNWTANINLQMNYWLAETCNLSDCAQPLFGLIEDLSRNGRRTAQENYGMTGWVSHHNIDLWRASNPVGEGVGAPTWANWSMSGPWLCAHLYDHYLFTRDISFLREQAYPLMKGCAEFCLDWLFEGKDGHLTTCPSVSTENHFQAPDGKSAMTSAGCTMDMALMRELFQNCSEAARTLRIDADFASRLEKARARLAPYQVGRWGQLQEWSIDFEEAIPGQRHMSHLYPLYPGSEITPQHTPQLANAARASLERRLANGGAYTGWSRAWAIGLWARLGDGNRAEESLAALMKISTNKNLFDTCPYGNGAVFQIDGNMGATAAIAEMLLQSHGGVIHLMPALPDAWRQGAVKGLRARGGVTVDLSWSDGKLTDCALRPAISGPHRLRLPQGMAVRGIVPAQGSAKSHEVLSSAEGVFTLDLNAGRTYTMKFS